ncbi:MAG: ATP-binding protein [Tissierellales bacterium]|nr:ATP-binding protein [Tissierellales bacterium]
MVKMNYIYKSAVCSDLEYIKSFIDRTVKTLNCIISNKDILFDIKVILNELIVNGALHGNECMKEKCVNLTIKVDNDMLTIEVEDEGSGIIYNFDEYNPSDFKSWGRGLVLVKGLSDEFRVENNRAISIKKLC